MDAERISEFHGDAVTGDLHTAHQLAALFDVMVADYGQNKGRNPASSCNYSACDNSTVRLLGRSYAGESATGGCAGKPDSQSDIFLFRPFRN